MDFSLRLLLEVLLSVWLGSAIVVGVMLQAASRPSPGFAVPMVESTEDPYRLPAPAASITVPVLVSPRSAV
jgi:hypothetical protein